VSFGFAFYNAAAGRYYVGIAEDDAGRSTLGALLTQVTIDPLNSITFRHPKSSLRFALHFVFLTLSNDVM